MSMEVVQRPVFLPVEAAYDYDCLGDTEYSEYPPIGVSHIGSGLSSLCVVESDRRFGNVDPRFTDKVASLKLKRARLVAEAGCRSMVAMVPLISDGFLDLDQGVIKVPKEKYAAVWKEHLLPEDDVIYDPIAPPYMIDLPTDGLITRRKGNGLMLNTADCSAAVLFDPERGVLALSHIGREGAVKDIGPKMLSHMRREYDVALNDLVVYFGPSVDLNKHVLADLRGALSSEDWADYCHEVSGGYGIDFVGYAKNRLVEEGVPEENITVSAADVFASPDHFSHEEYKLSVKNKEQDNKIVERGRNGLIAVIR